MPYEVDVVVRAVGVARILAPTAMATVWPWRIKALLSQGLGCLLLAPAVVPFVAARETRWSALRIATQSAILWFSRVIVGVVRAFDEFDRSCVLTWVFVVFLGLEWLLATWSYVALETQCGRARRARVAPPPRWAAVERRSTLAPATPVREHGGRVAGRRPRHHAP